MKTKQASMGALAVIILLSGFAVSAQAAETPHQAKGMKPAVVGTVTAINGTTLTVSAKSRKGGTTTTYTVDVANAKVQKGQTAATAANIAVGDMIVAQGAVNGTAVTATNIIDGVMQGRHKQEGNDGANGQPESVITGNGQPVVAGSVTAINGSTISITNKSGVSYSIDGTNAKVDKAGSLSTVSSITVGEMVVAQGTVNGTAVTATSIIDQGAAPAVSSTSAATKAHEGMFSRIGGFFAHLFGY